MCTINSESGWNGYGNNIVGFTQSDISDILTRVGEYSDLKGSTVGIALGRADGRIIVKKGIHDDTCGAHISITAGYGSGLDSVLPEEFHIYLHYRPSKTERKDKWIPVCVFPGIARGTADLTGATFRCKGFNVNKVGGEFVCTL